MHTIYFSLLMALLRVNKKDFNCAPPIQKPVMPTFLHPRESDNK